MEEICENCTFFGSSYSPICYRFPPNENGERALTNSQSFCGEFKMKLGPTKEVIQEDPTVEIPPTFEVRQLGAGMGLDEQIGVKMLCKMCGCKTTRVFYAHEITSDVFNVQCKGCNRNYTLNITKEGFR